MAKVQFNVGEAGSLQLVVDVKSERILIMFGDSVACMDARGARELGIRLIEKANELSDVHKP